MRIVLTGATGFIGTALCHRLAGAGHSLAALVRDVDRARAQLPHGTELLRWSDPDQWRTLVAEAPRVVNLAGAPVAGRRWSAAYKETLRRSRIDVTRDLVSAMSAGTGSGRTLVSGSAVGYYGNTGDTRVDEAAPAGRDFLSSLCVDWEAAAAPAALRGIRVVLLRTGVVLGEGGALQKMLTPFRMGLGGPIGSGRQWLPWIHLADAVEMIAWALEDTDVRGAVNVTGPNPVTMRSFAAALGRALRRPAVMPVPGFALRAVVGELAETLLGGQRAVPAAAERLGFSWRFPFLDEALADLLGQ